jgi:hypothetical protein
MPGILSTPSAPLQNIEHTADILASKPSIAIGVFLTIFVVTEAVSRFLKSKEKQRFDTERAASDDARALETLSLEHFKRSQLVDVVRASVYILLLLAAILIYDIQAFSYVLIALGAFIIVLKELVSSAVGYFFVLTTYTVGDDVRVAGQLGEIVRIRLLSTAITGKEENGEHNGKLFNVPNYYFFQGVIEQQELKSSTSRHITLKAVYIPGHYTEKFDVWVRNLKAMLDDTLPVRSVEDVGHYRGFTGARYKLNYSFDEDGDAVVSIAYVSSTKTALTKKEKIVHYIESTKRLGTKNKKSD